MTEQQERDDRDEGREDRRSHHFSCAFCHKDSPKPFKICESCGHHQPAEEEE